MSNELLSPNFWSIKQLFKYSFSVPVYQRPYSWQNLEVDSMLFDIWDSYSEFKELSDEDKKKASLYVGNIILHEKAFEVFDIIDGQQRITTFSIFLLATYCRLYELGVDQNHRILLNIQEALWKLDFNERPIKNKRVIELGSIDKEIMLAIFNEAYSLPSDVKKYVESYSIKSPFEGNVKTCFNRAYEFEKTKFASQEDELGELLKFANFILNKVYLIAIINEDSEFKAFSIFESINSKGKRLEDIDLIKTRIFSNLSQNDYESYLNKWGKLIIDTGDRLYDYLKIYIKANIKYYSSNISYNNFKNMDNELCIYFKKDKIGDAYKSLIEDMVDKVECFNAVYNLNKATAFVSNNKFRFYYSVYTKINYEHPWPLFFKCFCEYKAERLSKDDLIDIVIETIKFSITFLTVCARDSKDVISMFINIFEGIYNKEAINKNWIIYQINNKMISAGIRKEDVVSSLENADVYSKNRLLGAAVLSTYDSRYVGGRENQISWDEAYSKFSTYGASYSLDHIMVQTPSISDPNLKYYKLGNNLKLKNGHDFPSDLVHDGMEYNNFKNIILHRVGNLRLKGGDGNSSHGNTSEEDFSTYSKLKSRNELICTFFADNVINIIPSDKSFKPEEINNSSKTKVSGNIDFSMEGFDLTRVKPRSITFDGKTSQISSLKEIFTSVAIYLFGLNKEKMFILAKDKWTPRKRIIISNRKSDLTSPFEVIKDMVYFETNLSAKDIIYYSNILLEEFNVDKSTVSIYIPE